MAAEQEPAEEHVGYFGTAVGWFMWKPDRAKSGPQSIVFTGPEEVIEAANQYFEWARDNPLYEAKTSAYEGEVSISKVPKLRVLTIIGLCNYCGIHTGTWRRIKLDRADLLEAMLMVESYIYQHKFEGAAVNLLNPVFIGRAIGLTEKTEITGPGGGPLQQITSAMTAKEAADAYAATLEAGSSEELDQSGEDDTEE